MILTLDECKIVEEVRGIHTPGEVVGSRVEEVCKEHRTRSIKTQTNSSPECSPE